jgi:predicted acyltransferase
MAGQDRFVALDVFRGMTICFMIIVNSPGSWSHLYAPLEHASWHGFTPTDLVFPSFLFAVGNAMAFVMGKYVSQGDAAFWKKTLKRSFLIFFIGFMMYWFPFVEKENGEWIMSPLSETRIPGVLQRIALCYLIASIVLRYGSRTFVYVYSVLALVGYWVILYFFGDPGDPYSLEGNAVLKLDLLIFGPDHLYHGEGIPFDPEGLLSTLPATVNVIIGYLAGQFIRRHGTSYETIARLMLASGVLIFVAFAWDMVFPFNKKIWTSSFVLLTSGINLAMIASLIYLIDIAHYKRGTYFFTVFGRNPLFIYITASILLQIIFMIRIGDTSFYGWMYRSFFGSIASPTFASLLTAIWWMLMNWLIGYGLDRKGIYVRV